MSETKAESSAIPPRKSAGTDPRASELRSFFSTVILLISAAFLIRGAIVEPFKIPSGSMRPTLMEKDHILVCKFSYGFHLPFVTKSLIQWGTPSRGDVVVFMRPDDPATTEDDSEINIIKRVVGLPGDTVEVRGMQVFINGVYYPEPYARWIEGGARDFGPEKVPEGRVFLMGDNRDASKDGRFWTDHFLEVNRIKGRAMIIYWTWDLGALTERIFKIIR